MRITRTRFSDGHFFRHRKCGKARYWHVVLLALFPCSIPSCTIDFTECESDNDCHDSQRCDYGIIGSSCETPCAEHEDCDLGEFCGDLMFDSFRMCHPGCRIHDECPPGERCEEGKCEEGCRTDEDCPGGYCGTTELFGPHECQSFVEYDPIECGELMCDPIGWRSMNYSCCASMTESLCGMFLIFDEIGCKPVFLGEINPACPDMGPFVGCQTSAGLCGVTLPSQTDRCAVLYEEDPP